MSTPNVGMFDRLVRIIVGLILLALSVSLMPSLIGVILIIIGIAGLVTGLTGRCPLYIPLKIDTHI